MITLLVFVIFIIIALAIFYWRGSDMDHIYKEGVVYFGHRGDKNRAPENTISSYRSAINSGLKAIELDVRSSKDGKVVCSHNIDLERETTGSGFIDELTYEEISLVKAGRTFKQAEHNQIPLLEEVLKDLSDEILINIEIKSDSIFDLGTAKKVLNLIKSNKIKQQIIVSSFNPIVVRYIKCKSKSTPTAFIYEYAKHFKGVFIARPDCLNPDAEFIDDSLINFCKKRKMRINAWTVNNSYARDWLIKKGIEGIITDNPEIAV